MSSGGNLIVVDDYCKSRTEAAVETFRRAKVEGWNDHEIQKHLQEAWDERAGNQDTHRFVDSRGRSWSNAAYLQMLTRTTLARIDRNAQVNTLVGNGCDLARISEDGGGDVCEACARWEGKVVSLTGATKGFPTLADAEADGLFHPNCVHRVEYLDEDEIEDALKQSGQADAAHKAAQEEAAEDAEAAKRAEEEKAEREKADAWLPSTPLERATDALMRSIGAQHTDAPLPLSGVNPHFSEGWQYQVNCQRCVPAAEARARGYDVEAKPYDGNSDGTRFWKDATYDWHFCRGGRNFRRDAEAAMSSEPDGSRFLIRIKWPGGARTGAHFFMAEKDADGIHYSNPQDPSKDAAEFFNRAAVGRHRNWILRIDDREFTPQAGDAFQPSRGTA